MASEPKWLVEARKQLGTREVVGGKHNPKIVRWFKESGHGWIKDDETAWCAAFVGAMLAEAGERGSGSVAARSYLKWGKALSKPVPGAIAVFPRGGSKTLGHVGIVSRVIDAKTIEIISGNARNSVRYDTYKITQALGFRWPDNLRGSTVVKGSAVGIGGGTAITADNAVELADQLSQADSYVSAGTIFGLVIGIIITGAAIATLYARWNAGGRPVPDFFPEWLKGWLQR